jgi:membrane-bound serine protease (ClpP class)
MRRGRALALLVGIAGAVLAMGTGTAAADQPQPAHTILSVKLSGVVDPFMASYVQRAIGTAEDRGDVAVLVTINTPGGLDSSMREIISAVLASKVPVICYTAPSGARAASAGTFIMEACPINAMAPGTNIGAAHPVGVSGAIENEKVTNDAAAFIRSLADRWHRNADWAEQAVRDAVSLPNDQALSMHVVDWVAPSTSALLRDVGQGCGGGSVEKPATGLGFVPGVCGAGIEVFGMSVAENLFHSLADPNVAFLMLNIGFLALIAWVFHPGFHVSLAVGIVCTILGLAILETLPVRLTGLVLLAIAAILFVLDVKAQAHGVLTTGGIGLLVLGGLLLFNPSVPSAHVSLPLILAVAAGFTVFSLTVLRALVRAGQRPVQMGVEGLVGATGVTLSDLAPNGTVRVVNETWTAQATAGSIAGGTSVRVVDVRGVKLLVEPAPVAPVAFVGPATVGTAARSGDDRSAKDEGES